MFDFTEWKARNPLKAWREQNGITQSETAIRLGVSLYPVQRWETGGSKSAKNPFGEPRNGHLTVARNTRTQRTSCGTLLMTK